MLKMLEIGTCMELKAKTGKLEDSVDTDFADISFEELLAQEKKDYSFWWVSHIEPQINNSFQQHFSFIIFLYTGRRTGSQDRVQADDEVTC